MRSEKVVKEKTREIRDQVKKLGDQNPRARLLLNQRLRALLWVQGSDTELTLNDDQLDVLAGFR